MIEPDQKNNIDVNNINSLFLCEEDNQEQTKEPSQLWHPPVDVSHLDAEQQQIVKERLYEVSSAFSFDENDIGYFPSLQMTTTLKDDVPVQQNYAAVPRPVFKEIKEYIQDLLVNRWIVKSKLPYPSPVVCVLKK